MSGVGHKRGILTAGGKAVHRVRGGMTADPDPDNRSADAVPLAERYQQLSAQHVHRVAVLPAGPAYLIGCSCGHAEKTAPGLSEAEAYQISTAHAISEGRKLQMKLEGADDGN